MSKLAYAFAFLFAIAGIILSLIGIIWFFILKTLFSKRKQKLIDQEIYKQKMLENEKIVKEFFKKENGFYVWVFCLDLKDKHLKLLEKFDLNKKKRNTKAVFLNDSCYIPEKSLSKHISIIGSTGVGKTTTAKKFIKAAFENDWNFIFLDGKADIQFEKELNELAKKNNKKLNCWSKTANNEFKYNPFKGKTMEENISLIMEGFDYTHTIISDNHGVAYYKMMEKSILDSIYPYMVKMNPIINFFILEKWTNRNWLLENIQDIEFIKKVTDEKDDKKLAKVKKDLEKIVHKFENRIWDSLNAKIISLKNSFNFQKKESSKSISEILKEKESQYLYFSIPTLASPATALYLAKLVLVDIKQSHDVNKASKKKTLLFFDEFGSYATAVLTELLLQGRSYGFCVVLLYQGLAEVEKRGKQFAENVFNNTITKIVHRCQETEGVKKIASWFGTKKRLVSTEQFNFNSNELTGTRNVRIDDSYIFEPNVIRKLAIGQCLVLTEDEEGEQKIYEEVQKVDFV